MSAPDDGAPPQGAMADADASSPTGSIERRTPGHDTTAAQAIPPEVARRYGQAGRHLLFPDGEIAIEDRGSRLIALTDNLEVARDLVTIAHARGWTRIDVRGSERFRAAIERASNAHGITTAPDRSPASPTPPAAAAAPAQAPAREPDAPAVARPAGMGNDESQAATEPPHLRRDRPRRPRLGPGRQPGDVILGRFVAAGSAPYRFDPSAARSYFVRLETPTGTREVWGTDLARALRELANRPQPGDEIAVRLRGYRLPPGTDDGRTARRRQNIWQVEQREDFERRAEQANALRSDAVNADLTRDAPALRDALLLIRAGELFAARRLPTPRDRERFVHALRERLSNAITVGDPVPEVRLRASAPTVAAHDPSPTRRQRPDAMQRPDPTR